MKSPSKEILLKFYEEMLLYRRFEEKCGQLYGMGLIGGFCHLYIGQEAVLTGVNHAMEKGDAVVTSYRDHAHVIASGIDPKFVMAELLGRKDGCSKGKGGSMHLFNTENRFYGGHGIVGAQVPIGTGLAFAAQYRGEKNASITYFGDGAVNQGQVYEAFNMAALWKLPALYVIENNEYSMGTSLKRACATTDLYNRGASFGIPGEQVDGMNVVAVAEAAKEALAFVKSGKGPMILEMKTYRYRGHSMSDPAKYRSKEEVASYKDLDPIENVLKMLAGKASEEEIKAIDKKIKDLMVEVIEFSKASPEPDVSELFTDIYNQ